MEKFNAAGEVFGECIPENKNHISLSIQGSPVGFHTIFVLKPTLFKRNLKGWLEMKELIFN